ncbi:MAG: hydrogen peroxide-inducible genes activator [Chitinophagaceae bacterium]|nr:MAG: hydrogen peroxide-inducible genes activator [Chitinophagaceae bacterium]
MTLVQLEYIIALDTYRSFVTAAEKCFVTQPTLSMQVQKLEDELGVKLFDRTKLPVVTTEMGKLVIAQARTVIKESMRIPEIVSGYRGEVRGALKVGVIPTLAPYLLPPLVAKFTAHYPLVKLEIWEYPTEVVSEHLKKGLLDCGLLATPLNDKQLHETPLFYESFVVFTSPENALFSKKILRPEDLPHSDIWLLNEGHCMRNQVLNICSRKENIRALKNLEYNTGSVETLKRMVELNAGWTILPELSISDLSSEQLDMVRYFRTPEPVREISLVTDRHFVKEGILKALRKEILLQVPEKMKVKAKKEIVDIHR